MTTFDISTSIMEKIEEQKNSPRTYEKIKPQTTLTNRPDAVVEICQEIGKDFLEPDGKNYWLTRLQVSLGLKEEEKEKKEKEKEEKKKKKNCRIIMLTKGKGTDDIKIAILGFEAPFTHEWFEEKGILHEHPFEKLKIEREKFALSEVKFEFKEIPTTPLVQGAFYWDEREHYRTIMDDRVSEIIGSDESIAKKINTAKERNRSEVLIYQYTIPESEKSRKDMSDREKELDDIDNLFRGENKNFKQGEKEITNMSVLPIRRVLRDRVRDIMESSSYAVIHKPIDISTGVFGVYVTWDQNEVSKDNARPLFGMKREYKKRNIGKGKKNAGGRRNKKEN